MATPGQLTFPAGVLAVEPVRLPLVARGDGWFAVNKPAGVAVGNDPLEAKSRDLGAALASAIAAGKPQLTQLGITRAGRVHWLDAECTGVLVFATSPESEEQLRNAVGSQQCEFVFELLAETGRHPEGEGMTCDLPLARHATEPRMVVSHAAGKKCRTAFAPVETLGRWMRWEARTRDNRPHQIRAHASEVGLRIPGESTYGGVPRVFLSDVKPKYRPGRDDERPLHPSLALHLREIVIQLRGGGEVRVEAPRPKSFDVLLRRLGEAASSGPRQLRF